MVLHPEACWGGLPTHVQKTNTPSCRLNVDFYISWWRHLSTSSPFAAMAVLISLLQLVSSLPPCRRCHCRTLSLSPFISSHRLIVLYYTTKLPSSLDSSEEAADFSISILGGRVVTGSTSVLNIGGTVDRHILHNGERDHQRRRQRLSWGRCLLQTLMGC